MNTTPVLKSVYTPQLGRDVWLREDTSDQQVWADTFTGLYHIPPSQMLVPTLVLDLGSNIGLTVAHYRTMWPESDIVGYEMDYENCDLATVNEPHAMIFPLAIAGQEGSVLYDDTRRAEAFTYVDGGDTEAKAITLLQAIENAWGEGAKVDFVKMDIEGAEWDVIEDGSWCNSVRHLIVELHSPERAGVEDDSAAMVKAACERLENLGFHTKHHPPHPRSVYAKNAWL